MKHFTILILTNIVSLCGSSQSTSGLTGKRDTSYNLRGAYEVTIKTNPEAKIVTEFHSSSIAEEKNIAYCNIGDRKLLLDAFYPKQKTNRNRIAVIIIHGGGWRTGNRTLHYPLAQHLADLGYVCFTPEYRLSTEALYPAAVHDIKSVTRWVRKNAVKFNIDENKIAVAGHSAGGELAAMMGATNGIPYFEGNGCDKNISPKESLWTSKVNAVIDMDGLLAFIHKESGEGDDSKRISAATNWFGYSKAENPELWKQGSPLTHIGSHAAPILFLNSNVARMHAGRDDFIKILDEHNIYSEVKEFDAPHSFVLFEPWFTPVLQATDSFLKKVFEKQAIKSVVFTVAKDGSGNYRTVQEALDAIPQNNKSDLLIYIRNGVYNEKLLLDSTKQFVTLVGEDRFKTVLTYNDHTGKIAPNGDTISTRTSWSFKVLADHFKARDITFQNNAGPAAGQAVAMESDGDKAVFINCRFIGDQDVLYTNSSKSRQYFENCYIEGTTDFIFGSSTVWFEKCHIHSKKNSHVTAASTPKEKQFGYVFNECVLTGDTSLHNVSLGRPWRPYAHVVYMNCFIGGHIKAEGWSNWNNTDNYKTTRFSEYKNYGPSSDAARRINWSKQLTDEEAKRISILSVLSGWDPKLNRF